jgi:putative ABC transport system ATP-binding protein
MIELNTISHQYNNQFSLNFKDWKINKGEEWLLLGDSGSGKTTLLHILSGLLKPTIGTVLINDTSLYQLSSKELDRFRGCNIGIVFQRPHLIKSLTIQENLLLAQSFAQLPEDLSRVSDVLGSLDIQSRKHSYPQELSQGQLQRASIARALINKPTLLIADEPTSSLDDKNTEAVLTLLKEQSAMNGATLIVATHDKRIKDAFVKIYQL